MININQTSEQTKILIPRSNINGDIEKNNYVTEDELQEQLKNINIPYLVVDHIRFENGDWGYGIVSGDYNEVLQAIKENKPQIIYIPYEISGTYLLPHSFSYNSIEDGIYVSTNIHNADNMNFHYYVYLIKENSVAQTVKETRYVQEKLVSGENIKTINGNDILGSGDIVIENGTDIPYLLIKYEYPNNVIYGDFDGVVEAIENNKPYLIYTPYLDYANTYIQPTTVTYNKNTNTITANSFIHSEVDRIQKLYYTISSNNVTSGNDILFVQPKLVSGENIKTINGNDILGDGDIIIEGGNGNIVELTQEEYNNTTPEPDTLYVISDAPAVEIPDTSEFITESELNSKGYTTSNSFKTINNQSIVGSGNITINAGGGTEILYLWKLNGTTTYGAAHNASVRNTLLSLSSSEEYPIIVVKDYNNDTICNNVYANASTNYVEIQCCNSRIGGTPNDLTDERYELLPTGMFRYVKNDVVATQNYVDEQIGNINNVLENIIG